MSLNRQTTKVAGEAPASQYPKLPSFGTESQSQSSPHAATAQDGSPVHPEESGVFSDKYTNQERLEAKESSQRLKPGTAMKEAKRLPDYCKKYFVMQNGEFAQGPGGWPLFKVKKWREDQRTGAIE